MLHIINMASSPVDICHALIQSCFESYNGSAKQITYTDKILTPSTVCNIICKRCKYVAVKSASDFVREKVSCSCGKNPGVWFTLLFNQTTHLRMSHVDRYKSGYNETDTLDTTLNKLQFIRGSELYIVDIDKYVKWDYIKSYDAITVNDIVTCKWKKIYLLRKGKKVASIVFN